MKRTKGRICVCLLLIAVVLAFIWGNSTLNAEQSSAISDWVGRFLSALFPGNLGQEGSGRGLLRKLAHFSEFACLGSLLCWLTGMLNRKNPLAVLGGFSVACIDECIQIFSPGRNPSLVDVGIDTAGAAVGVVLLLAVYSTRKGRKL